MHIRWKVTVGIAARLEWRCSAVGGQQACVTFDADKAGVRCVKCGSAGATVHALFGRREESAR
jgi:hypothetical protein